MIVDLALNFYEIVEILAFIIIPSITAIVLYFRKIEKKLDSYEINAEQDRECLTQIKSKVDDNEKNVKLMFQEHKLEVKDDESELKILSSNVNTLTEKVSESEKVHVELKNAIRDLANELKNLVIDQRNFMTTWNQRIEDRIEALREEFKKSTE